MNKTTPLQNAIIMSSIMGSILSSYDAKLAKDRRKPINTLRKRIHKFMFTRARTNKNEFLAAIKYSDKVWRECVNHFADKKISIESVSTLVRLYDLYEEPMSRYANINEKQMESFAKDTSMCDLSIETNSYEVADFILNKLSKYTDIKRRKLNLLSMVKDD